MKQTLRWCLEQLNGMDSDKRMIRNKNVEVVEVTETLIGKRIEGVDMLRSVVMILFVLTKMKEA